MTIFCHCENKKHGEFKTVECPSCNKKGQVYRHRTKLKVIFNPFLRLVNMEIASVFDDNNKFISYKLMKTKSFKI